MTWDYRVLRRKSSFDENQFEFGIYEVYYDENGNTKSCSEDPVFPIGETQEELVQDLSRYVDALKKPCLDWHSF